MSLEDEARSGRPLDATDEEMCKKVWDLVYSDRQIQVEEIAQALTRVSRSLWVFCTILCLLL